MPPVGAESRRVRRHIDNLGNADERIARRAEASLIRYYGPRALDDLIEACRDSKPHVRFRAVWALAHTRSPRAYEPVLALTDDPDERVRYDATLALGVLGDARALEPLARMWKKNDVTRPAANALAAFGIEALAVVEDLLRSGDSDLRRQAVNVLGHLAKNCGSARAAEVLAEFPDDLDALILEEVLFWRHELGVA